MPVFNLLVTVSEASLAASGAAVASNPFEVVKTRLQLQGQLERSTAANTHYRGTLHCFGTIARNEGLSALYKGFGAALAYQSIMNGLRLGLYDDCKGIVGQALPEGMATNMVSGVGMGFVSNWIASPLFLVKTRQQAQSSHVAVGEQHQYRNFVHGLRSIAAEKGVRGLWHGSLLAGVRTAVGSGVQLASYDGIKPALRVATGWDAGESRLHFMSSLATSGVVAVVMNPFDVVMTRVYTASASHKQYSANFAASFAKIARAEGVHGLFKGTTPLWARVGPHTICTFVFLERIRATRKEYFPHLLVP